MVYFTFDMNYALTLIDTGHNLESAILVASLREVIDKQIKEIEFLQRQLKERSSQPDEVIALTGEARTRLIECH